MATGEGPTTVYSFFVDSLRGRATSVFALRGCLLYVQHLISRIIRITDGDGRS